MSSSNAPVVQAVMRGCQVFQYGFMCMTGILETCSYNFAFKSEFGPLQATVKPPGTLTGEISHCRSYSDLLKGLCGQQ